MSSAAARTPSIEYVCPTCGADPGEPCRSVAARSIRNRAGVRPKIVKKLHTDRVPVCYREPLSRRTACNGVNTVITNDDWKLVTCTDCLNKQHGIALNHAHYCGKEFEANPGSNMHEYLDGCAYHFGADTFAALPNDKRLAIREAFDEGRAIERRVQRFLSQPTKGS